MFQFDGSLLTSGIQSVLTTVENQFWWDRFERQIWTSQVIDGAARDSGNTNYTDMLRPGLLLGKVTSSGKLKEWSPTATDGTQRIYGILAFAQKMQRAGSNADRWTGAIMLSGAIKANRLLVPGQTSFGISGLSTEFQIRRQLHSRFIFDDMPWGNPNTWEHIYEVSGATTTFTVTTAHNNFLFTNRGNTGNLVYTLPTTPYRGLRFGFYNVAAGTVGIAAGTADTMVFGNEAAGTSVAYDQAAEIIGNHAEVIGDGTSWLFINHLGREAYTVTVVT